MSETLYLKRVFQSYYRERKDSIPPVSYLENREFGFIPWEKQVMIRHTAFHNLDDFRNYLMMNVPKHVYSSGTIYDYPSNQTMEDKGYRGCDLIIDIDVDHFYTPCKDDHDLWQCSECGASGKGMIEKCPKCGKLKLTKLEWICEKCLDIARKEILKLIYDFLIPDFGLDTEKMKIAFSGNRGYHLKIEDEKIRTLSSEERREIVDYLTGENVSLEILGLRERNNIIFGLLKNNIGWSEKIVKKLEELLQKSDLEIETYLSNQVGFKLSHNLILSLIKSKKDLLRVISSEDKNIWAVEGFGLTTWKKFLKGLIMEIGARIDEPVSIDIHRLIRYPGSIHGKTGFRVQELEIRELESFNPLDEDNENLDPIVFFSKKKNTQKIKIVAEKVPITKIKGISYGPYEKNEIIEVPHHVAIFLLCKEVAKLI